MCENIIHSTSRVRYTQQNDIIQKTAMNQALLIDPHAGTVAVEQICDHTASIRQSLEAMALACDRKPDRTLTLSAADKAMPLKIEIDYASDDSCQIHLWSKGHHDNAVFLAACVQALQNWDGREVSLDGKSVTHTHWRTVRADAQTRSYGVCETVHIPSLPGRGAYAVTVLDDWPELHLYQ